MIGAHHLFLYAQLKADPSQAAAVFDTLNSSSGPVVILFFALPIALLLLAVSTFRAGIAPLPAMVLAVLFFVIDAVPVLPGEELIPLAIGLVAFSWIARSLVHVDAHEVRYSATAGEVAVATR